MVRKAYTVLEGGPGSGNFGHSGRPGLVGGSGPKKGEWKGNFEFSGNPPYNSNLLVYHALDDKNNKVGRFVVSRDHRKKELHIWEAEVNKSARGKGITKDFIKRMKTSYPSFKTFIAHSIADAIPFWEKMGFRKGEKWGGHGNQMVLKI